MRSNFALIFGSIFDRFWTLNRPQNQSKINQKILSKSTSKQARFQLHLRSNFEDNLMFKQNGGCSKIVPKHCVFVCFWTSAHANQSKHATCNALKNHQKPCQKISYFSIEIQLILDHFWHRFPSPKFKRLGEGLGLDLGLDFRPCLGPKRRPNGIKNSSRKKMPT